MSHKLKAYPKYRDSGLQWLGIIPAKWRVKRNGQIFAQRIETGFSDLPILEVSLKTGIRVRDLNNLNHKQVMSNREKYKLAAQGDIVYNMMRMWQGAVGIVPVDGLVSPAYVVVCPFSETESRYYSYLFRTASYAAEVNKYSHGIVADRNRLYWEEFKQMPSAFPPKEEQIIIADFLDRYTYAVRHFINAKRHLIRLLEEQKQAIIHRAVSRGLDPSVPLKPSGVEWLGDVPEHWEIMPLRRATISRCDGPFGSGLKSSHYTDQGVRVVRLQNIGYAEFKNHDSAFISQLHYASLGDHTVEPGDLLIAGLGDENHPSGRACVAPSYIIPAMVKADCFRFRLFQQRLNPEFAALQLTATALGASSILSTGATRQRTNLQATASRSIALPPLQEQIEIVQYIVNKTSPLRLAIKGVYNEISLLREYRARLISDVVTGKLDVRGVNLPAAEDIEAPEEYTDLLESEEIMEEDLQEEIPAEEI